jgi:hypothetical protein
VGELLRCIRANALTVEILPEGIPASSYPIIDIVLRHA